MGIYLRFPKKQFAVNHNRNNYINDYKINFGSSDKACFSPCDIPVSSSGGALFEIAIEIEIEIGLFPVSGVPFSLDIGFCLEQIRFSIVLFCSDPDRDFDSDSDFDFDEDIGLLLVLR